MSPVTAKATSMDIASTEDAFGFEEPGDALDPMALEEAPAKATPKKVRSGASASKGKAKAKPPSEQDDDLLGEESLEEGADLLLDSPELLETDGLALSDTKAAAGKELPAAAKALASIKVGPKGVYTEDSIRVYLQEIGRIRLLRPDEEIELARKIADLLQLEELAAQFEADHGHHPDTKEWAALVEMPTI